MKKVFDSVIDKLKFRQGRDIYLEQEGKNLIKKLAKKLKDFSKHISYSFKRYPIFEWICGFTLLFFTLISNYLLMFIFNKKRSVFCYFLILAFYVLSFYIIYLGEIETFMVNRKVSFKFYL